MSYYDLLDLTWYFFTSFLLLPLSIGIRQWPSLTAQERGLVVFLGLMLFIEIVATLLRYQLVRNHFFHYGRTWAVLWISAYSIFPLSGHNRWLWPLKGLLAFGVVVEVIGWVGFNHINTVTRTVAWLLAGVYSFIGLTNLLETLNNVSMRKQPNFYYYCGFLLWSFFSVGNSCLENYFIETSLDLYYFCDTLLVMVSAVAYVLFAIGLALNSD